MIANVSGVKGTPAFRGSNAEKGENWPLRQDADSGETLTVNASSSRSHNVQWLKSSQTGWSEAWFERSASISSPLNDV